MTKYEKLMEIKLNEKLKESNKKIQLEMNDKKRLEIKFYMKKLDEKVKRQIKRIENDYEKKFKVNIDFHFIFLMIINSAYLFKIYVRH